MTDIQIVSTRLLPRLLICGMAVFTGVASAAEPTKSEGHHWSYSGETGPEHWDSEDPAFAM